MSTTTTQIKKTNRNSSLVRLGIVISIFVGIVIGFVVLVLMTNKHAANTNQISKDLMREFAREEQLRSIERLIGDIASERAVIRSQFVPADNIVSFINDIEDLNQQIDAEVLIGSVTEVEPNSEGIGSVTMQLQINGSWRSVLQAIALVESFPVVTTLGDISIRARDGGWSSNFMITTVTNSGA